MAVASQGAKYEPYADAVRDNGVDGEILASLDGHEELIDIFDELEITSKLHRKVLTKTLEHAKTRSKDIITPQPAKTEIINIPEYSEAAVEYSTNVGLTTTQRLGGRHMRDEETAENQEQQDMPNKRNKVDLDREKDRQYGDRFLLARQDARGIMRLGGNGQETFPHPCPGHSRLSELGAFPVACYSDLWQPNGPQYAGQCTAAVDGTPNSPINEKFSVFMRRSLTSRAFDSTTKGKLLGWEYCGDYVVEEANEANGSLWEREHNFPPVSKCEIAKKMLSSSKTKVGYGRHRLDYWRKRLEEALNQDASPSGPQYLIENRVPTEAEMATVFSMAARARALGFSKGMSDEDLSKLIVRIDEFHKQIIIRFVEYNEAVYDYVKRGLTDKGPDGKLRKGGPAAKAQDWYDYFDGQVR